MRLHSSSSCAQSGAGCWSKTQTRWCHTQYDLGCCRMACTMNFSSASNSSCFASVDLDDRSHWGQAGPGGDGQDHQPPTVWPRPTYRSGSRFSKISRR